MMRECYAEAAQTTDVYGDWRDAFLPEPDIGLFAPNGDGDWKRWHGRFSPRPGLPGDTALGIGTNDPNPWNLADYMSAAVGMMITLLLDVEVGAKDPPAPLKTDDPDRLAAAVTAILGRGVFAGGVVLIEALGLLRIAIAGLPRTFDSLLVRLVDTIAAGLRQWLEDHLINDDRHRHVWELVDLVMASVTGTFRDGLLTDPRGLDAINDHDCRDWLRRHGASERAVNSAFVQGLYDLALAYEDGDPARPGIAAGQGMRGALRMFFGYRGALFWRMRAGMGDVVFAPLYHVLRQRGVRIEFFHRLTNVGVAADAKPGARTHIASLDFDVQARLLADTYEPLIEVAGRPCWPAQPRFEQLADPATDADFESHWDRCRAGTLRLEVGRDFDFVVLGVSVGAIPDVCPEILARDARWRRMVAVVKTVATQAFQVWLDEDLGALGWRGPPWLASAFAKPFDSWCDMAHVIPEEDWADPPATAVYFCGVLADGPAPADDDREYPARRNAEVKRSAAQFLQSTTALIWPGVRTDTGVAADDFRWGLLADPVHRTAAATGSARFDSQYWRANVNPSDRYVLSLPGSLKHRISPLDMTYDNMTIAGDWTDCGLNTGCTEAAIMSGRLAAHALSGAPALERIIGYDHP